MVFAIHAAIYKRFTYDLISFGDMLTIAFPQHSGAACCCPLLPQGLPSPLQLRESRIDYIFEIMEPDSQLQSDLESELTAAAAKEAQVQNTKAGKERSTNRPKSGKNTGPQCDTATRSVLVDGKATFIMVCKSFAEYIVKISDDKTLGETARRISLYACMVGGITITISSGNQKLVKKCSFWRKYFKTDVYTSSRQLRVLVFYNPQRVAAQGEGRMWRDGGGARC